jgi:hypothetical protein
MQPNCLSSAHDSTRSNNASLPIPACAGGHLLESRNGAYVHLGVGGNGGITLGSGGTGGLVGFRGTGLLVQVAGMNGVILMLMALSHDYTELQKRPDMLSTAHKLQHPSVVPTLVFDPQ